MRARLAAAVLSSGALLLGCASAAPAPTAEHPVTPTVQRPPRPTQPSPTAQVVLEPIDGPPVTVRVEVARTESSRRRGLMYRREMPADAGMLFLFEEPERQSFWMRNTFLRLDILFIDSDHRVVGVVEDATPLTDDERAVEAESQYVLEVHAGFARAHGLGPGTLVRFVDVAEE